MRLLAVAGDFDSQEVLHHLEEMYDPSPPGRRQDHPGGAARSPPGRRTESRDLEGPSNATYIHIAYRAPAAVRSRFFAFTILDSLLCGPTRLNMFGGGGISNKTSRLYRALVEAELAVTVRGGMQATIDPFLYEIVMTVRPERTPRLFYPPWMPDQTAAGRPGRRSRNCPRHQTSPGHVPYGSENITNQAFWLGYAEMFASYDWFSQYVERLAKNTPGRHAAHRSGLFEPGAPGGRRL